MLLYLTSNRNSIGFLAIDINLCDHSERNRESLEQKQKFRIKMHPVNKNIYKTRGMTYAKNHPSDKLIFQWQNSEAFLIEKN